jgi:hypothetical protein
MKSLRKSEVRPATFAEAYGDWRDETWQHVAGGVWKSRRPGGGFIVDAETRDALSRENLRRVREAASLAVAA